MFEVLSPNGVVAAALIAPPGPDVLTALAGVEVSSLPDFVQVDLLIALERQSAWLSAHIQPVLAAVGDSAAAAARTFRDATDPLDLPERAAHAEVGAALRLHDQKAASVLETARTLTFDLPAVHAALAAGEISFWHASAIVDATNCLPGHLARQVAERVLARARRQTVTQLRQSLRRAVLAADPDSATDRVRKAHAERKVDWWPLEDGMAELRLIATATDVMAIYSAADALAKQTRAAGPKRDEQGWLPLDALRSDALVQLLIGCQPVQPVAVNVTIDLATLLGLQDHPGELAGYGPLPAPLARKLAADGRWRRMILEPMSGHLLDMGHSSYEPSAPLARFVQTRDRSCVFPTCNRASRHCEVDHDRPYRPDTPGGGRTDRDNLHPRCANHHKLKHKTGWTIHANPITSQSTWTSPLGKRYVVEPEDHRSTPEPCPF